MKTDFACMPHLLASRHAAHLLAFDDADQRDAGYRPGNRALVAKLVALIEICMQSSRSRTVRVAQGWWARAPHLRRHDCPRFRSKTDVTQERVDFFVSCLPWMVGAPREVSGGGVHVFFKSTELSRAMFPTKSKAPNIDIITVTRTGTGHNVNVAPSGNKRRVVGFSIFHAAPPPIPDKLVRLLEEACIQLKAELQAAKAAKHATDATGKECTGVKRKSPSAINMARPVDRQHDRDDEGWLSRAGLALGAKLFSLVGLDDCMPARFHIGPNSPMKALTSAR